MARTPLYSRSPQHAADAAPAALPAASPTQPITHSISHPSAQPGLHSPAAPESTDTVSLTFVQRLRRRAVLHRRAGLALLLLALIAAAGWPAWTAKVARPLTLQQIDAALRESISKQPLASAGTGAYETILPSVVRVVGHTTAADGDDAAKTAKASKGSRPGKAAGKAAGKVANKAAAKEATLPAPQGEPDLPPGHPGLDLNRSVGTGVVIVDKGLILTSLHVIEGADRITVTFFDGSESEAIVVSRDPANDLAVLQAKTIPDDLHAATLRSTAGLAPGEAVLAVGFPFGIGPSASQGVISGLKREFRSPEGQRILTNLIQFDAAANPGNSGGPLVTLDGHVVGIVAAIMNPNMQRTFIGIGFAVPIENAAAAVGMPPF